VKRHKFPCGGARNSEAKLACGGVSAWLTAKFPCGGCVGIVNVKFTCGGRRIVER